MTDMTKPFDGGPAFPVHGGHHPDDDPCNHTLGGGMTLRDWFAGQAIGAVISQFTDGFVANPASRHNAAEYFGKAAYEVADAMLEARDGR